MSQYGVFEVWNMLSAQKIVDELKKWNVTHVIGLPDNGSARIYEQLHADAGIDVITVSREGEAFAIASGLYVGGKQPVVIIQNTGLLESGDAIRGTAFNMKIPLVVLIGYRGYQTMQPGSSRVDTAATFLEPTLRAWEFPYSKMETDDDIPYISDAFRKAKESSMPTVVLVVGICT
jgi:sulfopyruvate decarboxylase TPP-binding subunit